MANCKSTFLPSESVRFRISWKKLRQSKFPPGNPSFSSRKYWNRVMKFTHEFERILVCISRIYERPSQKHIRKIINSWKKIWPTNSYHLKKCPWLLQKRNQSKAAMMPVNFGCRNKNPPKSSFWNLRRFSAKEMRELNRKPNEDIQIRPKTHGKTKNPLWFSRRESESKPALFNLMI